MFDFLKKKHKSATMFAKHYDSMLKITKTSKLAKNASFELLPAMYFIASCAVAKARNNQAAISEILMKEMDSLYPGIDEATFNSRIGLYNQAARGMALRCDWIPGKAQIQRNLLTTTYVVLGDILYNPACADNYSGTPVVFGGAAEKQKFYADVMQPLFNELQTLFTDFYNLGSDY